VVFAADGGLEADEDNEDFGDLSGDEVHNDPAERTDDVAQDAADDDDLKGAAHKVLPDPGEPTTAEVEDHRACGHVPYRSWCAECVESRGVGEPHRTRKDQRLVCVFAFDYLFIGKDGKPIARQDLTDNREEVDVKILIAKDTRGKAVFSHVIPQKGVDQDHYSVDVMVKDVLWLGFREVFLKSDNEPAILKLLEHALTELRLDTKMDQLAQEHPNTYDPSGNGEVESTVKQFQVILRAYKRDLEKRIGAGLPVGQPLVT